MGSKRLELQEALQNQKSSTTKHQEALQNKRRSTAKPRSASVNSGRLANEIVTRTLLAYHSSIPVANGSWANKIVINPVDGKLKAVGDILDVGNDVRDNDADIVDDDGDYDVHIAEDQYLLNDSDEDADILDADGDSDVHIVEDQSLPTDSDEVADIHDVHRDSDVHIVEDQPLPTYSDEDADLFDADGDSDVHIAEDQPLPTYSDEDADLLDADGDSDVHIAEEQSLPTNSENSSRKRSREMAWRQVTDPHTESNNANCTYNGQGSTSMLSDSRIPIIFDKYGRPCDAGSEKFVTDIGRIVRAHCRPAIESWKIVPNSMKDKIWKDIVARYVVSEVYKPHVLSRACKSWKGWKQHLRRELDKHETVAERKIKIPWRLITNRDDWESFVDLCNTDEHRKLRAAGKKAQEAAEFTQSCGRKGIFRKIYELEKTSPTGEVNRAAIFVGTHTSRNDLGEDKMKLVKELVEANPDGQNDIDNDAVALVCGRDSRGSVKGMGGGVSRTTIHASATTLEILRKVQQENKSLQSDLHLLRTQLGVPNHTFTPSSQSAPHTQNRTSIPSNQSAPPAQNPTSPSCQYGSHIQHNTAIPSNQFVPRAQNRTNQSVSRAPEVSNLPAHSRLAPDGSNSPVRSCLVPPASLPASSCFIKNFRGRTIALGSINAADPPMEDVHSLIIEEIFDRNAELFDEDGKLGDVLIGGLINWPKACVEFNFPANSCFIRNFKRKIIAFGSFNTALFLPMVHVYSIIVKEIYDRDAELFYEDGKLGDIMIGGLINWPKACVMPC